MSQENVEVLRRANAAFNRGDIDGFLEFAAEDIEVEDLKHAPDFPPVAKGKDALRASLVAWTEAFGAGFTGEIEEYLDVDEHHVACVVHYFGKEPRSGMEVDFKGVDIWEIRDGKLIRGKVSFPDRESALRGMGLSEQAMSQESIDIAKQGIAAINEAYARDDIAPWRQQVETIFDPEVVLEAGDAFTEGEWRGKEGAIGFVANQMEVLKEMWMRLDEFIDVDEDCFIVGITFGGQARHTAIPFEMHPFHVLTLRDGKILRWRVYLTREDALEAVGRSE